MASATLINELDLQKDLSDSNSQDSIQVNSLTAPTFAEKGIAPTVTSLEVTQANQTKLRDKWQNIALSKIAPAYETTPKNKIPMVRNGLINRAYGELYISDPVAFKWAGLAVFASYSIGCKLDLLYRFAHPSWTVLLTSFGSSLLASSTCEYLYKAVGETNNNIYSDIYWQHLAYQNGGIEELQNICRQGDLPEKVLKAWEMLDEGKKTGNEELIWQANIDILEHEQKDIIQPQLYEGAVNASMWNAISLVDGALGLLVNSPVPEDKKLFSDRLPGGNLGNFDDRWKWCIENIMPGWREYETKNSRKVRLLIKKFTGFSA